MQFLAASCTTGGFIGHHLDVLTVAEDCEEFDKIKLIDKTVKLMMPSESVRQGLSNE
jgi:hypothetical protein